MEKRSKEKIITMNIYTDGSLKKIGTTTFGGWAFIATRDGNSINESGGSEANTTNQRMELKAICEALEFASTHREPNERIVIHSDSAYAINCYLNEWYVNWQNNGWINSKKEIVCAFEVECTTSIYSGILRMSDLAYSMPYNSIKCYIVAPESRTEKVVDEISRPTFSNDNIKLYHISIEKIKALYEAVKGLKPGAINWEIIDSYL